MLFVREKRKEREQNKHTTKDLALFAFFTDHYSFWFVKEFALLHLQ
jgi:hypothetical protein